MKKFALACALVAAPFACLAQNNPWDAPWSLGIGIFSADASTNVRLDSNSGRPGTSLPPSCVRDPW